MHSIALDGSLCRFRPYAAADAPALASLANDIRVARWMTHQFPHPYTPRDAARWIATATGNAADVDFAVEAECALAGGIGITR